jgi:hypothetical protein
MAYSDEVLADTPTGYWRLDDDAAATSIHDYSGGSNDLRFTGVRLGRPGLLPAEATTSAYLDGASISDQAGSTYTSWAYNEAPSSALDLGASLTLEAWVSVGEWWFNSDTYLITKGEAQWGDWNYQLGIWAGYPHYLFFQFSNALNNTVYWDVQIEPDLDRAAHVAVTYDGAHVRFYLNGQKIAEYAETGVPLHNGVREGIYLGSDQWGDVMRGGLAEVAVYNHALSDARVLAHYRSGTGSAGTGLMLAAEVADPYLAAVLADSPDRLYRLDDTTIPQRTGLRLREYTGRRQDMFVSILPGIALPSASPLLPNSGNRSLRLLGRGTYAPIAFDPDRYTSAFSVEVWASLDAVGRTQVLTTCSQSSSQYQWKLAYDAAGKIAYGFSVAGVAHLYLYSFVPRADIPYHYALTYDRAAGQIKLYINGALADQHPDTGTPDSGSSIYVGTDETHADAVSLAGRVDEFAVYPTALSAARVAAHYAAAVTAGGATSLEFSAEVGHAPAAIVMSAPISRALLPALSPMSWFRAEGQNYADGEPVRVVEDLSGHLVFHWPRNDGIGPVFRTGRINGKAALVFNGTADYLENGWTGYMGGVAEAEAFIVVKTNGDPPTSATKRGLWTFSTGNSFTSYPDTDGSVKDAFMSQTVHNAGNPTPSLASYRVYNVSSKAGQWSARLDGVQIYQDGSNALPGQAVQAFLGRSASVPYSYLDGEIAEFMVFDRVLTEVERIAVQIELRRVYNLGPVGCSLLTWAADLIDIRVTTPLTMALPYDTLYSAAVLVDSPVAYWHLDEAPGATSVQDGAGQGNDSASGGAAAVAFGAPGAVDRSTSGDFNGTTSVIEIVPRNPTSVSGEWSVELWFKLTAGATQCVFSTCGPLDFAFDVQVSPTGVHADIGSGSSWGTTVANFAASISLGAWHHLVFVVTAGPRWDAYLDGAPAGGNTFTPGMVPLLYDPNHHIFIGRNAGNGQTVNGQIDEVAIYNHALTAQRVAAHYGTSRVVTAPLTLSAMWLALGIGSGQGQGLDPQGEGEPPILIAGRPQPGDVVVALEEAVEAAGYAAAPSSPSVARSGSASITGIAGGSHKASSAGSITGIGKRGHSRGKK